MKRKLTAWLVLAVILFVGGVVYLLGPVLFASISYPLPKEYQNAVAKYSQEFGLSPNFLAALIMVESRWRPNAQSHMGAVGLTQFIPSTARAVANRLGVSPFNPNDLKKNPEMSIRFGAYYISEAIKRYNGNVKLALIAYNGGGGAVNAYLAGAPIRGTVGYAEKVLNTERAYNAIYGRWWETGVPVDSQEQKEFVIEPRRDLSTIVSLPLNDFWLNLVNKAPQEKSSEANVEDFWKNILPEENSQ